MSDYNQKGNRTQGTLIASLLLTFFTPLAQADITITARETEGDVVFSYSGSLDTSSYTIIDTSYFGELHPEDAQLYFDDGVIDTTERPSNNPVISDPGNFGTGSFNHDGVLSGDHFGIAPDVVTFPKGYVSESPLSGSLTYADETFTSLGINPAGAPYLWALSNGQVVSLEFPPAVSPDSALRASLLNKIRKLKKKAKKANRAGQTGKAKKLKKKIKKLTKQLRSL